MTPTPGPLAGVRFVELGGIGPVPHAGMLLADLGAAGTRVDRPGGQFFGHDPARDPLLRGRPTRLVDLRADAGRTEVLALVAEADILVEGFRPGVAERMGLGPDDCWAVNPALVYGRMTGWGQDGPWAQMAGHDINYSGLAGPLRHTSRPGERPVPALNLLADHGGGSLYLVMGVLAALLEARSTGRGVVVDAAMVDGAANLMSLVHGMRVQGTWPNPPGENVLDGGCPFYDTYTCSDGRYVAVGPLEPPFFAELLAGLGLADAGLPAQWDQTGWPVLRARLTEAFAEHPRAHWEAVFAGTSACVTPVLDMTEAPAHPHLAARGTFVPDPVTGQPVPGPAPRFPRRSGDPG
ncbi:MAG: CoA transferase [Candidatus Nanopelagicales bacterium]|nr:CoA transferase [Candidatus Nanopelagicales bacterium]